MSYKPNICEMVRDLEQDYTFGKTKSSKYVEKSMYEDLCTIDAYLNSKHVSGPTDSLGREKPFFNIVTAAVNIWFRSTDIDTRNIKIKATKSGDVLAAFLATVHIQDWMRRENFAMFINDWGRALARYGSSVPKFVEKDGKLHCNVIPWQRLIVDPVDFENNIKVEILEYTEAQLYQQEGYDKEIVEKLCDAQSSRETIDGTDKDNKDNYIKLYEVHGLLPLSFLTDKEEDDDTYVQQMHVVSFIAGKEKGEFDDYTLIKGKEAKDPYMLTHLIKEDGQTLSIGAVQHLFEAQWMMNHTAKSIKDYLDITSKLILQTSDGTFLNNNALTAIENGDILIHKPDQPITQVNMNPSNITALQSYGNQWKALSNELTGISESMLGNTAPSGTAWRQVEALLNESHSLFEVMTENKGLYIVKMFTDYIIPHIKKRMDTSKEIAATLDEHDIKKIDAVFVKNISTEEVNRAVIETVLNGGAVTAEDQAALMATKADNYQKMLNDQGNQRFFVPSDVKDMTWKEVFKDLEWDLQVDVTGEGVDKDMATTWNTLLAFYAKKQGMPLTPYEKLAVNKILMQTGSVSPMEISAVSSSPQPQPLVNNASGAPAPTPVGV